MKGEKPKTSESCPRKNSSESERYEGAPTLIGIVGDELVEVEPDVRTEVLGDKLRLPTEAERAPSTAKGAGNHQQRI